MPRKRMVCAGGADGAQDDGDDEDDDDDDSQLAAPRTFGATESAPDVAPQAARQQTAVSLPAASAAIADHTNDTKLATAARKQGSAGKRTSGCCQFVLNPSGGAYCRWSLVVSCAFLYNFWSLSYRFAFKEIDASSFVFWFTLDYSADTIYLLDVIINFHTGFLNNGVLERNLDKISAHYKECTLFYLDCFCLLPLDILYLSIGYNSVLRFTRLVKIYKFWSYVDRTERHTNYPNVFRTFTLVHYILVIFHWNACIFHMLSKSNFIDVSQLFGSGSEASGKQTAVACADLCQYLRAFYWSGLALTTIGHFMRPTTNAEYVYVAFELLFGLFLFAAVLGHVADIVTNVSSARKEFQASTPRLLTHLYGPRPNRRLKSAARLDSVKTFMRTRRVSDELQNKVVRWFDYLWMSQKSSDEERSVSCLPDRLKAEIAIHVHLDTLKRVDIFQNTEAGFLCELVLRLKPVLFSPGDYVCRKDEVGHEMYIVSRGILEVVTDEGKTVVATLKAGSYFGEISVLNVGTAGNKRTASVRSVGYSDLFCLIKQDLWDVLKDYPNAEARIRAKAEERLSKLDFGRGGHQRNPPNSHSTKAYKQTQKKRPATLNIPRNDNSGYNNVQHMQPIKRNCCKCLNLHKQTELHDDDDEEPLDCDHRVSLTAPSVDCCCLAYHRPARSSTDNSSQVSLSKSSAARNRFRQLQQMPTQQYNHHHIATPTNFGFCHINKSVQPRATQSSSANATRNCQWQPFRGEQSSVYDTVSQHNQHSIVQISPSYMTANTASNGSQPLLMQQSMPSVDMDCKALSWQHQHRQKQIVSARSIQVQTTPVDVMSKHHSQSKKVIGGSEIDLNCLETENGQRDESSSSSPPLRRAASKIGSSIDLECGLGGLRHVDNDVGDSIDNVDILVVSDDGNSSNNNQVEVGQDTSIV